MLGGGPIQAFARFNSLAALIDHPLKPGMHIQFLWQGRKLESQAAQTVDRHGRAAALIIDRRRLQARPCTLKPVGFVGLIVFRRIMGRIKLTVEIIGKLLRIAVRDDPIVFEPLSVNFTHGRVLGNLAVHQWLGETGLVAFIVAMAAGNTTYR